MDIFPQTTPEIASRRNSPRLRLAIWLCLLLIGIWAIDGARILWQGWQAVVAPTPTCNTEMHIADGIRCVADGQPLYPKIEGLPYVYHFYNPLTYLPAGIAARTFDLDVDAQLIAGRILPFAAAIGLLALLAWYARRQTRDPLAAALVAGMMLYFHTSTLTDFFRNRPETPAILLSIAGWILCQRKERHWIVFAALCFAGAAAFKQSFVAAPIACGLQLLLAHEYRSFTKLTAATAGLVFATLLAGYFWLGDGYLDHTIFALGSNPIDPIDASARFYPILIFRHWGLLLPAAVVSVVWLHRRSLERGLVIYLATSFALTTICHGKIGADLNYHAELSTLMVLATALAIAHALSARSWVATCNIALLAVATCWPLATRGAGWNQLSFNRLLPDARSFAPRDGHEGVVYAARFAPLRDRALIFDDEIAVRLGRPVITDWVAATVMFHTRKLDFEPVLAAIREHKYEVIVMRRDQRDNWAHAIYAAAIASDYQLVDRDERILELRAS
jgi:hypothetical protein